ncbi:hypothetical protein MKZ02_08475 [Pseudobacillus sp. FSL P4-0506]|uniref:hypothetical protein n=1 Tax=unclassified Pseudobacillus TaxID=2619284 RepID=UPI0030FBBFB6
MSDNVYEDYIQHLHHQINTYKKMIQSYKENDLEQEYIDLMDKYQKLEEKNVEKEELLAQETERSEQLSLQLSSAYNEASLLNEQIQKWQTDFAQKEEQYRDMCKEKERLAVELQHIREEYVPYEKLTDTLNSLDQTKQEKEALLAENKRMTHQLAEQDKETKTYKEQMERLSFKLKAQEEKEELYDEMRKEKENLELELEYMREKYIPYEELEGISNALDKANQEKEELLIENQRITNQLAKQSIEAKTYKEQLEMISSQLKTQEAREKKLLAEERQQNEQLSLQLHNTSHKANLLSEQIQKWQSDFTEKEKLYEEILNEKEQLEIELQHIRENYIPYEKLEKTLNTLNKVKQEKMNLLTDNEQMASQLSKQNRKAEALKNELEDLSSKLTKEKAQHAFLREEHAEIKRMKDEIEKTKEKLEKERSELKESFLKLEKEYEEALGNPEAKEKQELINSENTDKKENDQSDPSLLTKQKSKGHIDLGGNPYAFLFETYLKDYLFFNKHLLENTLMQEQILREAAMHEKDSQKKEEPIVHMNEVNQNIEMLKQSGNIEQPAISSYAQQTSEKPAQAQDVTQESFIQVLLEQKELILNLQEQIKELKTSIPEKQKGGFLEEDHSNNSSSKSVTFRDLQGASVMQPVIGNKANKYRGEVEQFQRNLMNVNKLGLDSKKSGSTHENQLYNKETNHWSGKGPYVINLPPIQANSSAPLPKVKSSEKSESDSDDISTPAPSNERTPTNNKRTIQKPNPSPVPTADTPDFATVKSEPLGPSKSSSHLELQADFSAGKEITAKKKLESSEQNKKETQPLDAKYNEASSAALEHLDSERPSRTYRIVSTYERKASTLDKEPSLDPIAGKATENQEISKQTSKSQQAENNEATKQIIKLKQEEDSKANKPTIKAEQMEATKVSKPTAKAEQTDATKASKSTAKAEQTDASKANKQMLKAEQTEASKANKQMLKAEQMEASKTNKQIMKAEQAEAGPSTVRHKQEDPSKTRRKSLFQLVWDKIT